MFSTVSPLVFRLIVIIAALTGLIIAVYIHRKKKVGETLVCPLNANCETVIHSEYAHFLGIPVEFLGMLYYALIVVSYGALVLMPALAHQLFIFAVLALTVSAFLFSLYLTFIQLFAIKDWCTWCLASASLCTVIFFATIFTIDKGVIALLGDNRMLLTVAHLLGVVVGFGGAIITDTLSFKFLRDGKMSEAERDTLHTISQLIWLALAVIVVSGLGLFLPASERLLASNKFLAKMVVVMVVILNGATYRFIVEPKVMTIFSGNQDMPAPMRRLRRLAFALGGISSTSWLTAFVLGLLPPLSYPLRLILGVYGCILLVNIGISQVVERRFNQPHI